MAVVTDVSNAPMRLSPTTAPSTDAARSRWAGSDIPARVLGSWAGRPTASKLGDEQHLNEVLAIERVQADATEKAWAALDGTVGRRSAPACSAGSACSAGQDRSTPWFQQPAPPLARLPSIYVESPTPGRTDIPEPGQLSGSLAIETGVQRAMVWCQPAPIAVLAR